MRCTGVPQSGQGLPYRPCAAIPSRKAVTFSGNALSASARQGQRGPLLRARLRQEQRPVLEVESRERHLPAELHAAFLPVEPAGDHQVEDQKEPALEREDDALSDAIDAEDSLAGGVPNR